MTFHDFFHELSTFSMTLGLAATLNISQHHQQQRALFACIQAHTVLQKLCLGINITTQGNYVTLIIICYEHQNKLKYIL